MIISFIKYAAKFARVLFWETMENAPMVIGILLAVRIQSENLALAFVYLVAGMMVGVGLIHFTEVKKGSNQPLLKETIINFAVFTTLATPFVFYFSMDSVWWSNWITDIILGVVAGGALAVGESWGWKNTSTVKVHAVSMAISAVLFLLSIRLIYRIESLAVMLMVGLIFILLISIIIVLFDYWPIKKSAFVSP
jgi:hypothetical protein